ncbi:URC4/urg3 family protein [Gordonia sp. ABSL49_1]|uniref:URC4/urg3 family protein n=1 Tax=Gordonia sp. ABSL49_1 TaxID=2920941 RepID=UPI001F0EEF90|nr:URC4/urg3 family protein [Gordonia sp. ABSL49_1]MCH5642627.1 URC4/urg3 family protein [Gordonia sp. ABSL49_1]
MGAVNTDVHIGLPTAVTTLRSTTAIRQRSGQLLERARQGDSPWFIVQDNMIPDAAALVAATTRQRYPDLDIPFHSRWRHFEAGGIDRLAGVGDALGTDAVDHARAQIDLALVSVLLDAGAGAQWQFREPSTGLVLQRSEGLGVASWHAFFGGLFSGDPRRPHQVDADGLAALTVDGLGNAFQVTADNPLVGLAGRVELLHRLGTAMAAQPETFGTTARPAGLYDRLRASMDGTIAAHDILVAILDTLGSVWPADNVLDGHHLGDCWHHRAVSGTGDTAGWMPFHKLSQWLTYSLLEPIGWSGIDVTGLDALTGLPEYRNGGLLLDTGVLRLRDDDWSAQQWRVGDELIVEWRALTVALLDELADHVRGALDQTAEQMPLACVLEGGTWATGRELAESLRSGLPPISIISDGTVF